MDISNLQFGLWSFNKIKDLGYDLLCYYETNKTLIFKNSNGRNLFRSVSLHLNDGQNNFSIYDIDKKQLKVAEVVV